VRIEPAIKRVIAFVDGQNLFYAAKEAFGYAHPNYEPRALASAVCAARGWRLVATRFYTGVPDASEAPDWNRFWVAKLAVLGSRGVHTVSRPLRYRNQTVLLPGGATTTVLIRQEKGIDVRLALDAVRLASHRAFDVALLFSQDQDLAEVADEIRSISREQDRWMKLACAFPSSPTSRNRRGVNRTDWIPIDRVTYDACLDPNDYRPASR